jgi:hypothetical protein
MTFFLFLYSILSFHYSIAAITHPADASLGDPPFAARKEGCLIFLFPLSANHHAAPAFYQNDQQLIPN